MKTHSLYRLLVAALLLTALLVGIGAPVASAADDVITLVEGATYTIVAGEPVNFICPLSTAGYRYHYWTWGCSDSGASCEDNDDGTAVVTGKKPGTYTLHAGLRGFDSDIEDLEDTMYVTLIIVDENPPVITKQPANLGVPAHEKAVISVEVDCAVSVSYQWYYRYPGNTEFTLSYSDTGKSYDITMLDSYSGMQAYCEITNTYGTTVTTDVVTLTRFEITDQPDDACAGTGKNASTTVTAVGEGLTYQWYAKAPGAKDFSKTSCTSTTYSLAMNAERSGTEAYCIVTDKYGNTTQSRTTILSLLGITKQPKDTFALLYSDFTVAVEAEGEGLTYTWWYREPGVTNDYTCGSEAACTQTMYDWRSGNIMYCVIKNAYGASVVTNEVRVSGLGIITQPTGDCAASGKSVSTTVEAQGENLTYQWYVKDPGKSSFTKSSNTTKTYSFKMTKEKSGRQVYCLVTNKRGHSIKTKTVKLSMLTVKTQPKDATADSGKTVSTTAKGNGEGLKYTWYVKDKGSDTFKKSSVTKSTYSYKMTKAKSGRQVYCVITDKYGNSVQTKTVTLKLKEVAKITGQPTGAAADSGTKVSTTVTAKGDGLKYTWYVKDPGKTKFTKSSVKGDTYSYTMTSAKSGRQVYCVVSDQYGNKVKSKTVRLTMINVTKEPTAVTLDAAGKASTSVKVSGKGMTYQWYVKNYGADKFSKSSATGTTYSCQLTKEKPSRQVYCVITDKYGNSLQTKTVTLSIKKGNSGNDLFDREDCWDCGGDGRCNDCGGTGREWKYLPGYIGLQSVKCTSCNNGRCRWCNGTGYR